jgi:hypothetical protein
VSISHYSIRDGIRGIDPAETPLPASWTMMLIGLGGLGLLGWRRKRKAVA